MGTLNASQRRYVRSILDSIGTYLEQISRVAFADDARDENARPFSPDELAQLTEFRRALQTHIAGLIDEFQLELGNDAGAPSHRWNVLTRLEFMTVELAELGQRKLAGYGPLDDDAFQSLAARIDALCALIGSQKQLLDNRQPDRDRDRDP